jgi:hypothetical protein
MEWFSFTGTVPGNPEHYTLTGSAPACQDPQQQLCAIQAENDGNDEPILDVTILTEIALAVNNQANEPNVRLKERPTP